MKKIITILSFAVGLTSLVGCSDYLDSDYLFDERMSIEDVFSNRDYTNRWLARGYSYLSNGYLQDVCSKRDYPFNFADDSIMETVVMRNGRVANIVKVELIIPVVVFGRMLIWVFVK